MFTHTASPHTPTPTSNEVNSYFLLTYFTGMLLSYSHTHYIYTQAYLLEVLIAYLFFTRIRSQCKHMTLVNNEHTPL